MSVTPKSSRAFIIVKALPQLSSKHGETVCCAGITESGEFKRLFPVRFRHLSGKAAFNRWDWVDFSYRAPTRDKRHESCHVAEESIVVGAKFPKKNRAQFLEPLVSPSAKAAAAQGKSLALLRPQKTEFYYKRKKPEELEFEKRGFEQAASQTSLFDKELAAIQPNPYHFRFKFEDADGVHHYTNADWEAHAWFFMARSRLESEKAALEEISTRFNDDYPRNGMMFAIGNIAKRPQTWQLLGVLRVDHVVQMSLW